MVEGAAFLVSSACGTLNSASNVPQALFIIHRYPTLHKTESPAHKPRPRHHSPITILRKSSYFSSPYLKNPSLLLNRALQVRGGNDLIRVSDLNHSFKIGKKGTEKQVPVLKGLTFDVTEGEIVSIVGKSGSGKSTLLHILAGFLTPASGEIVVNGVPTSSFTETEHAKFRLDHFGFVFQNFQLMPGLTAFENVELPLTLKGVSKSERRKKVAELMRQVGLTDVQDHYPNELSGGQQQRVSIARALITDPPIIFADEPTGSLDSETEKDVLLLIQSLNKTRGITFVLITHDDEVAQIADRVFRMRDGELVEGGEQHAI